MKISNTCILALIGLMALASADEIQPNPKQKETLQTMTQKHARLVEELANSKSKIVTLAFDTIDALDGSATDEQIQPILQALATAAIVDPENESAQTAYVLINRFGEKRIDKLIMKIDHPSFLLAGITEVENESKKF